MALIKCQKCGNQISDQTAFCPNCGTKTESVTSGYGTLTFEWKGTWMLADTDVYLSLNGQNVGNEKCYSFKDGFSVVTPITSDYANITVKAGKFLNDSIECHFEKGKNYTCTFSYNRFWGGFTYEVVDNNGNVVCKKGLSTGRKVMGIIGVIIITLLIVANISIHISDKKERTTWNNRTEQVAYTKTKYVYTFVINNGSTVDATPFRLTIDTEEETAQLTVSKLDAYGRLTSGTKTYYGTCSREYDKPYIIGIGGFEGSYDANIIIRGEKIYWDSYQYIDTKNNYLYINHSAYKAKNPDYRLELTPVE